MAWVKMLNQCSTPTVLLALTAAQMYDVSKIHVKHVYFFAPYFLMQFCFLSTTMMVKLLQSSMMHLLWQI